MRKEVKLPSGAVLGIEPARFEEAQALYESILKEAKGIMISSKTDMASVYKDIFCVGFSSKEIKDCLWVCFKKCSYNSGKGDLKIDKDTFEPVEARQDYMMVCMEVAKENLAPFVKSLYAEYATLLQAILQSQP